jgi:hypothetical protein
VPRSPLAAVGIAASPQPISGSRTQHLIFTGIGAAAIAVWPALAAQRRAPASILVSLRVSAVVSLGFLILLSWTVVETHSGAGFRLAERMSSAIQTGWPLAVAVAVSLRGTAQMIGTGPDASPSSRCCYLPSSRQRAGPPTPRLTHCGSAHVVRSTPTRPKSGARSRKIWVWRQWRAAGAGELAGPRQAGAGPARPGAARALSARDWPTQAPSAHRTTGPRPAGGSPHPA